MKKKLLLILTCFLLCSEGFAQSDSAVNLTKNQQPGSPFANRADDNEKKSVSVYPNPSTGLVYLTLNGFKGKRTELRVVNVIGNVIHREVLNDGETIKKELDLSKLASGLYYIKLQTDDYSEIKKIIIN
ncbi:MAG: hypothetical protein JWQ14_2933 [Adhaeribacter sp.]|nr:hypothetical protein [Adhaeribacter sp.]